MRIFHEGPAGTWPMAIDHTDSQLLGGFLELELDPEHEGFLELPMEASLWAD